MDIEITEEGKGPIQIYQTIPTAMSKHLLATAQPTGLFGTHIEALLQEFKGEGFSLWYSNYWASAPVVLRARANVPVLELRIAWLNLIRGTWDTLPNGALQPKHFQLGFTPHVKTRAIFDHAVRYITVDIHFELWLLEKMGFKYALLDQFLKEVNRQQPAELSQHPHHCTPRMLEGVRLILHNHYSLAGKADLLKDEVRSILLAALEEVSSGELDPDLSVSEKDKLWLLRALIEADCPLYRGNDQLCKDTGLNDYLLYFGFKKLFHVSPKEYAQELRLNRGKDLLLEGRQVKEVALLLDYSDPSPFIRDFKKRFDFTPKDYQLYHRK